MEIILSQYAGFCSGVKRAYEMVGALDMERAKKPVFILGTLVHNEDVNSKIEQKGIKRIDREFFFLSKRGEIGTVIITAHGTGPDVFEHARRIGADILDTTCPKVIKVQMLAQVYRKRGSRIALIGDKGHKEVLGINDWGGGHCFIVSEKSDLDRIEIDKHEPLVVISQTTQDEDFVKEAGCEIKARYPQAEILSTTCDTTHLRQEEIKKMARKTEAVIVIGSKTSANSTRLFEIASRSNARTFFVENLKELKSIDLRGIKKLAVSAGASTPEWIIREVLEYLGK